MAELKAKIINDWVVCPVCGKKQFPISGTIKGLRFRCRTSRRGKEHYMIIYGGKGECGHE